MPCTELCVPQTASLPHPPPRATYASAVVTHHDLVSPRVRHLGCAQPLNVYQRTITIQGKMTVSPNTHAQLFHVELWVETECVIRSRWDKEAPVFMKISSLDFLHLPFSLPPPTPSPSQPLGVSGGCVRLRPLQCELGVLHRADGSARVVQGETAVLAAVYGPAEVKASQELCDRSLQPQGSMKPLSYFFLCSSRAALELVVRPESGLSSPRERLLEQLVRSCCQASVQTHLHPHTAISIVLQVENNDGAVSSGLIVMIVMISILVLGYVHAF